MSRNGTNLKWVNSGAMLADSMTKGKMRHLVEEFLRNPSWKLVDDPKFESWKKRQQKGKNAFQNVKPSENSEDSEESDIQDD